MLNKCNFKSYQQNDPISYDLKIYQTFKNNRKWQINKIKEGIPSPITVNKTRQGKLS